MGREWGSEQLPHEGVEIFNFEIGRADNEVVSGGFARWREAIEVFS